MKWIYELFRRNGDELYVGEHRHYLGKETTDILIYNITPGGLVLKEEIHESGENAGKIFVKYST